MTALQGELLGLIRRDRRRRTRRQKFSEFVGKFFTSLLSGAVGALLGGWMFMLGVAVIHDHWWPQVPTIGYWWAALVVWLLRGVFSPVRPSSKGGES